MSSAGGQGADPDGVGPATHAAAVVVRAALTLPAAVASSAALVAAILITPPLLILGQLVVLPLKRQLLTMRPRLEAEACRCQPFGDYLFTMIVDFMQVRCNAAISSCHTASVAVPASSPAAAPLLALMLARTALSAAH